METLYYQPKDLFPGVLLDKESGKFKIYGTSCPMDPFEFYDPIFKWFDDYLSDPLQKTILELNLNYYNTASSKFLLRIMYKLEDLLETGRYVKVQWYYSADDEDMMEEGEEFEDIVDLDFELVPIETTQEDLEDDVYFASLLNESF